MIDRAHRWKYICDVGYGTSGLIMENFWIVMPRPRPGIQKERYKMKIGSACLPIGSKGQTRVLVSPSIAVAWKRFQKDCHNFEGQKILKLFQIAYSRGKKDAIDESCYRRGRGMRSDATVKTTVRKAEKHLNLPRGSVSIRLPTGLAANHKLPIQSLRCKWKNN